MNINVAPEKPQAAAAAAVAPFRIERLGASLGAEILGFDLKAPVAEDTFKAFEAALVEHKVLVLRDQHLTTEQHVRFSRMFGDLEVHPMRPQGEFPEILVLDNDKDNPVLSTDVWHSDTTFRKTPTRYTILRCEIIPDIGGDTLWANMEAAHDGLSDTFRGMIAGLRAVHDFQNFIEHMHRRRRIDHHAGLAIVRLNQMERAVQMNTGFLMHGDPVRASFRKRRNKLIRILDHQMAIERHIRKGFAERSDNGRPDGQIWYEVSVHHVQMQNRAAAIERGLGFGAQLRKVCRQNRGCQFNDGCHRSAPLSRTTFARNSIIREDLFLPSKIDVRAIPSLQRSS